MDLPARSAAERCEEIRALLERVTATDAQLDYQAIAAVSFTITIPPRRTRVSSWGSVWFVRTRGVCLAFVGQSICLS